MGTREKFMKLNNYRLWTAMVTPLKINLTVDFNSLDRLLREQEEANNGVVLLGSTAEALNLSLDSKIKIVEYAAKLKLSVPLMVGIGGHDQEACFSWIKFLEEQPLDAYLMVTPIYAKPQTEGQYRWFSSLLDRVTRPSMLYNIPGRAAIELSLPALERLHSHDNFWAIKDSSGSLEKFKHYRQATQNKPIYCGDDYLFPDFAQAGSHGVVSVAANAWPKETNLMVEQCLKKEFLFKEEWVHACNLLFSASNPIPVKRLLFEENRVSEKTMMPPLNENDFLDCHELIKASVAIKAWFLTQKAL